MNLKVKGCRAANTGVGIEGMKMCTPVIDNAGPIGNVSLICDSAFYNYLFYWTMNILLKLGGGLAFVCT